MTLEINDVQFLSKISKSFTLLIGTIMTHIFQIFKDQLQFFRKYLHFTTNIYSMALTSVYYFRARNKDLKVKWPPTFKYGRSLWSCGQSLIYDKKNIRILMFEDSEKNIKVDKCLICINSNTKTLIDIELNLDICKFYLF